MENEDTGAVADDAGAVEDVQAVDAGAEAGEQVEVIDPIDVLLDPDNEPEFVKALNAKLEMDGEDSFSVDPSVLKEQPIEVQQLMVNLRNMALRRAGDAARAKQEAEQGQAELARARQKFAAEQSEFLRMWKNPELLKLIQPPEGSPPDFHRDPDAWHAWKAQQGFSERMTGFMEKMGAVSQEHREAVLAAQKTAAEEAQLTEIRTFRDAHDDFDEHFDDMEKLRKAGVDWPIEELYNTVRARKGIMPGQPEQRAQAKVDPVREARRRARDRGARAGLPQTPDGLGGAELQAWYDRNPGTRERDIASVTDHGFALYG